MSEGFDAILSTCAGCTDHDGFLLCVGRDMDLSRWDSVCGVAGRGSVSQLGNAASSFSDEETMMGIVQADLPGGMQLVQDAMEDGYSKEVGAPVRRLPTKQVSGQEVWTMTANAPVGDVTQSVVRHNDVVYKLMVVTQPDSSDFGNINRFLNSLTITPAPSEASPATTNPGEDVDVNKLLGQVGAFAVFLGIGLVIYQVFIRKKAAPPEQ
jgi:hypothetical protein